MDIRASRPLRPLALAAAALAALLVGRPAMADGPPAFVTKSGNLAIFGAPDAASPITALSAAPTLYRNGQAVPLGAPAWFPQSQDSPFVAYRLDPPASATDAFTFDAPAGWATSKAGPLPAASKVPVDNWTGKAEATPGFDIPSRAPVMPAGVNLGAQPSHPWSASFTATNRLHQGVPWTASGGGVLTLRPDGTPDSWTLPAKTTLRRWTYGPGNKMPARLGAWTLRYTDPGVGTPAAMKLWIGSAGGIVTPAAPVVSGTDVVASFDVRYKPGVTSGDIDVAIYAQAPAGADGLGHWTVAALWITAPDEQGNAVVPDPSRPLATDPVVLRALKTPSGRTPAVIRFMDRTRGYGAVPGPIVPADLTDPAAVDWASTRRIDCYFVAARRVNTDPADSRYAWSSPRIYGPQPYFVEGPDAFGKYLTLPPGDGGAFAAGHPGYQQVVIELRSAKPHGFTSGQIVQVWADDKAAAVPITNGSPFAPRGGVGPNGAGAAWVTGPTTILLDCYIPSLINAATPRSQELPQAVDSAVEVDLTAGGASPGWHGYTIPGGGNVEPVEQAAATASEAGAGYWHTIPWTASDELVAEEARRIAGVVGPDTTIYLEYANEIWNGAGALATLPTVLARLLGYVAPGTAIMGGDYVGTGTPPGQDVYGVTTILAGHYYGVFEAAWKAAGRDPLRVKRVMGSWWNGPYRTQQILETAQGHGIRIDHIAPAPYLEMPGDAPIVAFCGSAPAVAINDLYRHWFTYSAYHRSLWAGHLAACRSFGQPLSPVVVSAANSTAPGAGALKPGSYVASVTFADVHGRETTTGLSRSYPIPVAAGQLASLPVPAWPPWAVAMHVYLGDGGNDRYYKMVTRAEYEQWYPPGSSYPLDIALLSPTQSVRRPPAANQAADNTPSVPSLVTYEGGTSSPVPGNVPNRGAVFSACRSAPNWPDVVHDWHAAAQAGGAAFTAWYQCYDLPASGWGLASGPADVGAPGLAGFRAWLDATPAPLPSPSAYFAATDATTTGKAWPGTYGSQGYAIPLVVTSLPPSIGVAVAGASTFMYAYTTTDGRAPWNPNWNAGTPVVWSAASSFTVDVKPTDGKAHYLTLYCLDWDRGDRSQRIDLVDPASGKVFDTRSIAKFHDAGIYLRWQIKGPVRARVTCTGGVQAVCSGIFLDPAPDVMPRPTGPATPAVPDRP